MGPLHISGTMSSALSRVFVFALASLSCALQADAAAFAQNATGCGEAETPGRAALIVHFDGGPLPFES